MRKQKRESFLVMSMIFLTITITNIAREKKDNHTKAHQIYTRKEKLTSYCTKCKCRQQKYSLTPPPTRKQH